MTLEKKIEKSCDTNYEKGNAQKGNSIYRTGLSVGQVGSACVDRCPSIGASITLWKALVQSNDRGPKGGTPFGQGVGRTDVVCVLLV